ncbi:MAG: GerMN domain-containing protein [Candidatus Paceibacterota bacterium]|jgi:spore germination protein GerM
MLKKLYEILLMLVVLGAIYFIYSSYFKTPQINPIGSNAVDSKAPDSIDLTGSNKPDSKSNRIIRLYYPNSKEAEKVGDVCSRDSILPVTRRIPISKTPITDAINLLIKGQVTEAEKAQGFNTEFPHEGFELADINLKEDGTLILQFTEVSGFTTGGSCRIVLLTSQITKTAMQFSEVKAVKFLPEEIFQP